MEMKLKFIFNINMIVLPCTRVNANGHSGV
jgi:hypothetical protein